MSIIDKLIKLFSGTSKKVPELNEQNVVNKETDIQSEMPKVQVENVPRPSTLDMSINLVDDDLVEERIPCVYGPPSWYNQDGRFDRNNPDVKEYLDEVERIKDRNRQRKEIRDRLERGIDEPIADVYGPDPSMKR